MKFTERELQLLRLAMHMADEEGGWEYPELGWKEIEKLFEKIGGKSLTSPVNNGAYNHYLQDPRFK